MCLFYSYANVKIEIHICSNKHETGLVFDHEKNGLKKIAKLMSHGKVKQCYQ